MPPPALTPAQRDTVLKIAAREDGAWARAFFDGTAEAFCAHHGGLRHFTIDLLGVESRAADIPPTPSYQRARRAAFIGLALAAACVAYFILREHTGRPVGWWWLAPVGCFATAFLVAAAYLGVYARLPPSSAFAGRWVGFPGPSEGDLSGHTMPGLVKAHPIFCGLWLLFFTMFGTVMSGQEAHTSNPVAAFLGGVSGVAFWWAIMLCFSRGWVKEGD
jgi:hypothetical protein